MKSKKEKAPPAPEYETTLTMRHAWDKLTPDQQWVLLCGREFDSLGFERQIKSLEQTIAEKDAQIAKLKRDLDYSEESYVRVSQENTDTYRKWQFAEKTLDRILKENGELREKLQNPSTFTTDGATVPPPLSPLPPVQNPDPRPH